MPLGIISGLNQGGQSIQFCSPRVVTSSAVSTAGRCYAQYIGRSYRALNTINIYGYTHGVAAVAGGGGASLNWAELGVATSTGDIWVASLNLKILGYASIDTEARAGATVGIRKTISNIVIPANTDIWALVASSYQTTQASFRVNSGEEIRGFARYRAACQPSLSIGSTLTFTGTPGTSTTIPHLEGESLL